MKKLFYFNIDSLMKGAGNSSDLALKLLENYFHKKMPKNAFDKKNHADLSGGNGWLINPQKLFASKVDNMYKLQYIQLASMRDSFLYKIYGITYLDLSYWPDIAVDKLRSNPLLNIQNNKIYLLLEN